MGRRTPALAILSKTRRRSLPCGMYINQKKVMARDKKIEKPSCKTTDAKAGETMIVSNDTHLKNMKMNVGIVG
jgi:hypothetical protein